MSSGPALVSILRQGHTLVASIHTALDDTEMLRFRSDLIAAIGEHRSRGVIIDVAALDVLDSFGAHTLRTIAEMAHLRGAVTVIVGIQPDVAFAMVQLGMGTGPTPTAPGLEDGLAYLAEQGVTHVVTPAYRARTPIPPSHDADPDRSFRSSRDPRA